MPTLRELKARFVKYIDDRTHRAATGLAAADGVEFLCPKCFQANGGPEGTHKVLCWFEDRVPPRTTSPGRWTPRGTGLDDLTFTADPGRPSSVAVQGGCAWHGFVAGGEAN